MNSSMICLPSSAKQTEPEALCNESSLRSHPRPNLLNVLVVDDNRSRGEANAKTILNLGHSVELALDGVAALRMAAANRPHVVLLNVHFQGFGECNVARHLRSDFEEQTPLIIGFVSHASNLTRRRCVMAGMDLVLEAPLNTEAIETLLLLECGRLIASRNANWAIQSQQSPMRVPATTLTASTNLIASNQIS